MKTINNLFHTLSLMKHSKWILPALATLALVTLGVTGCSPPHH